MTESQRPSGEYPMHPSYGNGDAAYPPPPSYRPAQPIAAGPGTTVWPGSGGADGHSGGGDDGYGDFHGLPQPAPQPPARGRRRVGRPVALLTAVAVAAAVVGGATATAIGQFTDSGSSGSGGSSAVSGTTVSQSSAGTVAGVAQAVSPTIVEIVASSNAGQSTGSGVIITSDGEIVTNNHVIADASTIKVTLSTGRTYTAKVVGTDADKDLALIKLVGASGLKTATLGDSSSLKVGDQVVAIGSPEGLTGTVTSGIVSALDRDVTVAKDSGSGQGQQGGGRSVWPFEFGGQQFNGDTGNSTTTYKAIQTDASLNPGNSGGALINMNGEIIGINSAMYSASSSDGSNSSGAGSVGLGFAIPVNTLKADLDTLRSGNSF
ncbi:trypsin-like peptidase domain-containing protein [Streptomyces sp. NBC_00873]|uniref:S1C family serine protease n=1 Tax=unclassified Streptomyces TaxID=2593676 RepID=UPI00386C29C7|nr:trypsin-like peptidase domain-containing protein [Streptomyces sp. NBC_00873]WTA45286.1 trypsin-like peptidase domain-containing protein [Streptomyces sp. NBC_00842]